MEEKRQTGGRLWFKGGVSDETGAEHFAEDLAFPVRHFHDHLSGNRLYPYDFDEIDKLTRPLGVPWEISEGVPFSTSVPFIGFLWDLDQKTVALPEPKKAKYKLAILEWKKCPTHTLDETQKLYGKLLHSCHIIPRGRAYLTSLEKNDGNIPRPPFHSSPSSQKPRNRADVVGDNSLPSLPLSGNPRWSTDHKRSWLLRCQFVCWHRHCYR